MTARMRGVPMLALVLGGSLACEAVANIQDFTYVEPTDTQADGGLDAGGDAALSNGCPSGRGPRMVRIGTLCVDATEVTEEQYRAFLAGDPGTPPAACAWNSSYAPGESPDGTPICFPAGGPFPQGCVDFCDATMFCRWAGKQLCSADQWAFACGEAGAYPYGPTYDPRACNGRDRDAGRITPAGSLASCEGASPGLFDMSGNVWEWVDGCTPSDAGAPAAKDACRIRGGSVTDEAEKLRCAATSSPTRDFMQYNVGFRCCAPAR